MYILSLSYHILILLLIISWLYPIMRIKRALQLYSPQFDHGQYTFFVKRKRKPKTYMPKLLGWNLQITKNNPFIKSNGRKPWRLIHIFYQPGYARNHCRRWSPTQLRSTFVSTVPRTSLSLFRFLSHQLWKIWIGFSERSTFTMWHLGFLCWIGGSVVLLIFWWLY